MLSWDVVEFYDICKSPEAEGGCSLRMLRSGEWMCRLRLLCALIAGPFLPRAIQVGDLLSQVRTDMPLQA